MKTWTLRTALLRTAFLECTDGQVLRVVCLAWM